VGTAQFEREVTSERIRDKIAASKRKGLWVGGSQKHCWCRRREKRHYAKPQRRYDAILLEILDRPCRTQKEIAEATGYSPSQVSRILCSPDFQERYEVVFQTISSAALADLQKVRRLHRRVAALTGRDPWLEAILGLGATSRLCICINIFCSLFGVSLARCSIS